jgi:2-methylisocitrate lyase-like PEP mutase family enzyme
LHRLHNDARPLILVNAWDAVSARVLERAGASVIATTSAGMAWSLGYADGGQVPRDELVAACARICRVARVPVSVDIERGCGHSADEVCGLVRTLIELGAVGVNIEDGLTAGPWRLLAPQAVCERIAALRGLATQMKVRLFINARTDAYFATDGFTPSRFDAAPLFTDARAFSRRQAPTASSCRGCISSTRSSASRARSICR